MQSTIHPFSNRAELIKACTLIAWDELPAANVAWLDCVDQLCRSLKKTDVPFGGIPFVGLGDFRQVAPIVKGTGPTASRMASIKALQNWPTFDILKLHTPIRSAQDPEYTAFVDDIGEDYSHSRVSLDMLETVASLEDALQFLFPPATLANPIAALKKAFLSPKNREVDEFNDLVLDQLEGADRKSHGTQHSLLKPLLISRRPLLQCGSCERRWRTGRRLSDT